MCSDAWKTAGQWALTELQEELGSDWPKRCYAKENRLPAELLNSCVDAVAYGFMLEWALRLKVLRDAQVPGVGALRRVARSDVRKQQRLHVGLQTEVATLGLTLGHQVALEETSSDAKNPLDVRLRDGDTSIDVETFALLLDEASAAAAKDDDLTLRRLREIEWTHGVSFNGSLDVRLSAGDLTAWLDELEHAARLAAATGTAQHVVSADADITVLPPGDPSPTQFSGPVTVARGWSRTAGRLTQKAQQAQDSGATWLRADLLDGIFWASDWATAPMPEKTAAMAELVRAALVDQHHLSGVVVSSSACPAFDTHLDESVPLDNGSIGLRRMLPFNRVRETLVVPLKSAATSEATTWAQIYEAEPGWLDGALAKMQLPSIVAILTRSPVS